MVIYMAVSNDKLELPLVIGDSPKDIGDIVGKSANYISSAICRGRNVKSLGMKFIKVKIDEEVQ